MSLCTSDASRFINFLHCPFGKFSSPLQQLSSFVPTFSLKTLLATSQECALALVSLSPFSPTSTTGRVLKQERGELGSGVQWQRPLFTMRLEA